MIWNIPASEYHPFYDTYVRHSQGQDPRVMLIAGRDMLMRWYEQLPEDKQEYRYAEGKWTPKEVLGHIMDAERLFAYRAFRISRGDKTPMAGFDQDPYIPAGKFNARSLHSLLEEYQDLRRCTLSMIAPWEDEQYLLVGNANLVDISLRAQVAVIAGHERHHFHILQERYL
ncbi:MAG: DinB family protein [Bacteroidia bacterium]|jgi:uncharacterized damage-inducible protein DinB|nr:DinB family protein [Bacteroidia bacterium]